tara:strand:+ start:455 stop:655 length:201 start_codon:yes stop_codon:yes gene_type:complete
MKQKINNWLTKNKFFELTNFEKDNLIFCDNYDDKVNIVKKYRMKVVVSNKWAKLIKVFHKINKKYF